MGNNKKYVVEANIIKEASNLNLTLDEFLLLIYFENSDDSTFDINEISKKLKIDNNKILKAYNGLLTKKIISSKSIKNSDGMIIEKVSLDGLYELLNKVVEKEKDSKVKEEIFSTFESKFKRPLNGTEFEIIKAWLEKGYNEEVIMAALDEAIYNGAVNIRYIDTILYEWQKKGIKKKEDIGNDKINNKHIQDNDDFDYNWLEENDK